MRVSDLMKNPVVTAKPDDKLSSLVAIVSSRKIRHFPIVEGGKVVGIVSDSDLRSASTHPAVYDLLLDVRESREQGSDLIRRIRRRGEIELGIQRRLPAGSIGLGLQCQAPGHTVKPAPDSFALANRRCPAR